MKVCILSDVHGNLAALNAVLTDARKAGVDAIWSLGDASDWLPQSVETCKTLMTEASISVSGNHDLAVCNQTDTSDFREEAQETIMATRAALLDAPDIYNWLCSLSPSTNVQVEGETILLAHASPQEPVWTYLDNILTAREAFDAIPKGVRLFFHGHTHLAGGWREKGGENRRPRLIDLGNIGNKLKFVEGDRYLLCPGSVGLPNPAFPSEPPDHKAQWGLLNLEDGAGSFEWRRSSWNHSELVKAMQSYDVSDSTKQSLLSRAVPKSHRG